MEATQWTHKVELMVYDEALRQLERASLNTVELDGSLFQSQRQTTRERYLSSRNR